MAPELEDDEQQSPEYQVVNGFRLPVPRGATAASEVTANASTPAPTITDATRASMPARAPRAVNQAETRAAAGPELQPPEIGATRDSAVEGLVHSTAHRPPMAPPTLQQSETPGVPTFGELTRQRYELGKPIDSRDPTTHKVKPEYRMGIGSRILGTVGNFLNGFGGGRGPVTDVGPGATNARYAHDDTMRRANLANVESTIDQQEKVGEENRKLFDSANKAAYEGQVGEARGRTADAQMERAHTAQELSQSQADLRASQEELNRAKAGHLGESPIPKTLDEIALARSTAAAKGDKARVAILDGALAIIRQQHAAERVPKDTSAADVAKAIQVSEFRSRELGKLDTEKERERDRRHGELDKNVTIKYNQQKLAEEKAKIDAALENSYGSKYQRVNDQADQMLGLTKAGATLKANPAPATTKTAPAATAVPAARAAKPSAGRDFGPAPAGKAEGTTGTRPDGTRVIIKGGRIVSQ